MKRTDLTTDTAPTVLTPHRTRALAQLPADFHELDGTGQVNAILELPSPGAFVSSLAPDTFYLLVQHIGVADCTELLGLSTVAQRHALIDLGAWHHEALDREALDEWVDRLEEVSIDLVEETVASLDPELVVAYLLGACEMVLDRTEEKLIEQYEYAWDQLWSPDRDFVLILPRVGDDTELVVRTRRMLELLYRTDEPGARSILFSCKSGLRIEQEGLAEQFRRARLADLGFPDREDAVNLYAPVDIASLAAQLDAQSAPGVSYDDGRLDWALTQTGGEERFLARCLDGVEPDVRERFGLEFALCVNRAAVASPEGIQMNDLDRVGELAKGVYSTISVGLEHISDGDASRGAGLLARAWLVQLHQVGHALTVQLAIRARRLKARGGGLFDGPLELCIVALQQRPRPLFLTADGGARPFETTDELAAVGRRLAGGEAVCTVFEETFGFSRERFASHVFSGLSDSDKRFVQFTTLARTALCWVLIGEPPSFEPLTPTQLQAALGSLDQVEEHASALATGAGAATLAVLTEAAKTLRTELGALAKDARPDPRFLSGVVLIGDE